MQWRSRVLQSIPQLHPGPCGQRGEESGGDLVQLVGNNACWLSSPANTAHRIQRDDARQRSAQLYRGGISSMFWQTGGSAERGCSSRKVLSAVKVLAKPDEWPGVVLRRRGRGPLRPFVYLLSFDGWSGKANAQA